MKSAIFALLLPVILLQCYYVVVLTDDRTIIYVLVSDDNCSFSREPDLLEWFNNYRSGKPWDDKFPESVSLHIAGPHDSEELANEFLEESKLFEINKAAVRYDTVQIIIDQANYP